MISAKAALSTATKLSIIGSPEPSSYGEELKRKAPATGVTLDFRYLEADEFNGRLAAAPLIVLPYVHFAAQSGVLAKAMQFDREIVASDLPALREQAGQYPRIRFVPPGDVPALARVFSELQTYARNSDVTGFKQSAPAQWDAVAISLIE